MRGDRIGGKESGRRRCGREKRGGWTGDGGMEGEMAA
jgi:hypothetical protein